MFLRHLISCLQIMDNNNNPWDMFVFRSVFRELHDRQGLPRKVVVFAVHSPHYSNWFTASAAVYQALGHQSYRLAQDHLGPYNFVAMHTLADVQTLLSYRYELQGKTSRWRGVLAPCWTTNCSSYDLEIDGVRVVPLNWIESSCPLITSVLPDQRKYEPVLSILSCL